MDRSASHGWSKACQKKPALVVEAGSTKSRILRSRSRCRCGWNCWCSGCWHRRCRSGNRWSDSFRFRWLLHSRGCGLTFGRFRSLCIGLGCIAYLGRFWSFYGSCRSRWGHRSRWGGGRNCWDHGGRRCGHRSRWCCGRWLIIELLSLPFGLIASGQYSE